MPLTELLDVTELRDVTELLDVTHPEISPHSILYAVVACAASNTPLNMASTHVAAI